MDVTHDIASMMNNLMHFLYFNLVRIYSAYEMKELCHNYPKLSVKIEKLTK